MADTLFTRWLAAAAPGERTVYHLGNLATDRTAQPIIDKRAKEAVRAARKQLVRLTQLRFYDLRAARLPRSKRLAEQGYGFAHVYIAERTSKPVEESENASGRDANGRFSRRAKAPDGSEGSVGAHAAS